MSRYLLANTLSLQRTSRTLSAPLTRTYATSSGQDVRRQLERVAQLQREASAINSKYDKEALIASYPDLRDLLEQYVYLSVPARAR